MSSTRSSLGCPASRCSEVHATGHHVRAARVFDLGRLTEWASDAAESSRPDPARRQSSASRSPCDTSCQHDQRATNLLGWPSLVSLAARQLSRPLGKHDMCVAENALVEASVRIRVRVDVDVDAQGAGAPCDGC